MSTTPKIKFYAIGLHADGTETLGTEHYVTGTYADVHNFVRYALRPYRRGWPRWNVYVGSLYRFADMSITFEDGQA